MTPADATRNAFKRAERTQIARGTRPAPKPKVYHRAHLINDAGGVSSLCYIRPRAIRLSSTQSWTTQDGAVTCPKCLAAMARRNGEAK